MTELTASADAELITTETQEAPRSLESAGSADRLAGLRARFARFSSGGAKAERAPPSLLLTAACGIVLGLGALYAYETYFGPVAYAPKGAAPAVLDEPTLRGR